MTDPPLTGAKIGARNHPNIISLEATFASTQHHQYTRTEYRTKNRTSTEVDVIETTLKPRETDANASIGAIACADFDRRKKVGNPAPTIIESRTRVTKKRIISMILHIGRRWVLYMLCLELWTMIFCLTMYYLYTNLYTLIAFHSFHHVLIASHRMELIRGHD